MSSTSSVAFWILLKVWCTIACGKECCFISTLGKCSLFWICPLCISFSWKRQWIPLLSFYLFDATDGICRVPVHSSFFPGWKALVYFTLMPMQSCTFDHSRTSTRTWEGTEKLNDIAGQLQTWVSLQISQKGLVLPYNIIFETQATSQPAGSDCSKFSLISRSPCWIHEMRQAWEESGVVKESGIISVLRLLKNVDIIKAKKISMSEHCWKGKAASPGNLSPAQFLWHFKEWRWCLPFDKYKKQLRQ